MNSYFIYNIFIVSSILFAYIHDRISSQASIGLRRLLISLSFLFLLIFSCIRFDVGPDYETYVQMYYNSINGIIDLTSDKYFFKFLAFLFSDFNRGYIYVLSVYSFLTLFFVYLCLLERNILTWGIIIFCFIGFYLDSFDRLRQLLAAAVFLYSIKYIEQKKPLHYIIFVIVSSIFHFSAVLLIPVYFYNKINIQSKIIILCLVCLLLLQLSGFSYIIQSYIYGYIPYYNKIYAGSELSTTQGGFSTGLGFLFNMALIIFSIIFLKENSVIRNLIFTSGILMLLAPGNLNIMRFAQYFYISLLIALPYALMQSKQPKANKTLLFILMLIFFQTQQSRNNYEYQSIFSDNFRNEIFAPRASDKPLTNKNI